MNMNVNMDFQQSPQNGGYDMSNFINPNAIATTQMNGAQQFNPMPSIPQKRDSTGAALSRSQTPSQQPQFGFQQGFSHTPSPTLQSQQFRHGAMMPQRMQSPAQNPHGPQMSPVGFPQGAPAMAQGFDQSSGGQFAGVQLSQNLQRQQAERQRQWVQQQQMGNMAANNMTPQQRVQPGQMPGAAMQHPAMQRNMMQGQGQQVPHPQAQPARDMSAFLKNVAALNAQHGKPFNPQPIVAGRPINLLNLYSLVMRFKGQKVVTETNNWFKVTQVMGINPQQFPAAPEELRHAYNENLGLYERVFIMNQEKKNAQLQAQHQMQQNALQQQQMAGVQPQMSPTRPNIPGAPSNVQSMPGMRPTGLNMQQTPQKPSFDPAMQQQQQFGSVTPIQNNVSLPGQNGRSTPVADANPAANAFDTQQRKSMSRQLESTPEQAPTPSVHAATPVSSKLNNVAAAEQEEDEEKDLVFKPSRRIIDKWSGLDFEAENFKKRVDELVYYQPHMPHVSEMGVIDIRAITMSIRSGLHAESRLGLDMLAKLSYEPQINIELEKCEDLVEVLVDYGEEQLELLANDNPEVTDILDLMPYEDVIHNCNTEVYSLQSKPEFGSKEYDLDRTADRLLAITTIFRNFSFMEINHTLLSSTPVLKFYSNAIRLVGTRVLLLRSHFNTFDFMKDVVTFFSNVSSRISLPSRDDAYAILHFLCAFAPVPRPATPVRFTAYNPRIHRYLPSAVDSLAKLLARDDPNRTFYKQIFANEATSTPPYDLLTRAFGLAISVVPDRASGALNKIAETEVAKIRHYEARIAELRKPYLMQGMLAADILASLAPSSDSGLCRSWLESEDGWASILLRFAMSLCASDAQMQVPPQQQQQMNARGQQRPMDHDVQGFQLIVHRALSMLKRLGEKSKGGDHVVVKSANAGVNGHVQHGDQEDADSDDDMDTIVSGGNVWRVKTDFLPLKETLLGAMLTPRMDVRSLRQFCSIGYLDDMR